MRMPEEQASFFELLTKVLYYVISGYSKVGYLGADNWNKYYQGGYGVDVCPVSVGADSQNTAIYECVMVEPKVCDERILKRGILITQKMFTMMMMIKGTYLVLAG